MPGKNKTTKHSNIAVSWTEEFKEGVHPGQTVLEKKHEETLGISSFWSTEDQRQVVF